MLQVSNDTICESPPTTAELICYARDACDFLNDVRPDCDVPALVQRTLLLAYQEWAFDLGQALPPDLVSLPPDVMRDAVHGLAALVFGRIDEIEQQQQRVDPAEWDNWQRHLDSTRSLARETV